VQDGWIIQGAGQTDSSKMFMDWRFRARRMAEGAEATLGVQGLASEPPASSEPVGFHVTGPLLRSRVSYQQASAPPSRLHGDQGLRP